MSEHRHKDLVVLLALLLSGCANSSNHDRGDWCMQVERDKYDINSCKASGNCQLRPSDFANIRFHEGLCRGR